MNKINPMYIQHINYNTYTLTILTCKTRQKVFIIG